MRFEVTIRRFSWLVLFALQFGLVAHAQTTSRETQTLPVFFWGDYGDNHGLSSPGEVIAAANAREEKNFASCVQQSPHSCRKVVWGATHSSPSFPTKINDQYMWLAVDGVAYSDNVFADGRTSSSTQNLPSGYAVLGSAVCATDAGFSGRSTSTGPQSYRLVCVKTTPPPMQCPGGNGKSGGSGSPGSAGNPIQIYDGVKTESHVDYASADGLLVLKREFLGQFQGWRMPGDIKVLDLHTQDTSIGSITQTFEFTTWDVAAGANVRRQVPARFLFIRTNVNGELQAINPDGSHTMYAAAADGTFPTDVSGDRTEKLSSPTPEGAMWRLTRASNHVEEYGLDGRLRKMRLPSGSFVIYQYQNGQLALMQDNWGRQISFSYNADGKLEQATLPDGLYVSYGYKNGLLTRVTFADGRSRQFLYNEPAYVVGIPAPYSLTGTIDENGVRIGTYRYDASKRAVSTESAGGVNKYSFMFGGTYTQLTNPLGTTYTSYFMDAAGRKALSSQNQPAGSGCGPASGNFTYDSNGNVATRRDFNGVTTAYTYDLIRNLETKRVEASGTADARTISTSWHPTYRLPLKTAEPKRLTTFTYDAAGNLLTKTEQATTDANGAAGLNPTLTGTPRTWTWTYNSFGQMLTATGPRTDVNDTTVYTYDAQGNLATVTNAAGHVTTISNYDANGRAGRITDANGLVTDLSYSPRGWLLSRSVSGPGISEVTSYLYDNAGQLKKVTLPDNAFISYTYDDAHRLTGLADSAGNSIAYTLDAIGNHVKEQVKDPNGTLARQTSRVYDALNRLQQVTGGAQ
jgi:YD repeat-containing protein